VTEKASGTNGHGQLGKLAPAIVVIEDLVTVVEIVKGEILISYIVNVGFQSVSHDLKSSTIIPGH
jgi:hypothetical protein